MSSDINVQTFSGKVNITNNLLVGSSHLFVDTNNNKVGLVTADPHAGLHVNSNAYVDTDFRVGSSIIMNDIAGQITAANFSGNGSGLTNISNDSGSWVNGTNSNIHLTVSTDKVGIGVTDPDSKLEVRGNIQASFSDTDHGMLINAGGTILRNFGGNGAGFYFTTDAIWPTDYLGSFSAGGIDLGSSSYRWNNIYTEDLNASGTVTASTFSATSQFYLGTSASIRQSSTSDWTGDPGSGVGKIEYHSNKWYIVAGSNSSELLRVRRDGSDKFVIDNDGSISLGTVPAARISGTVGTATNQSGGTVTCTSGSFSGQFSASNASSRDKFRVYPSSLYCIGMQSGVTFGDLNDWAMTFQMNNEDDRGFWWGDDGHGVNQGAMALSTRGWLNVAERIKVGGGQTDTGAAGWNLQVQGNAYISSTLECDGRIYADNGCHVRGDWLRVDGQAGIYFQTYEGGWYMTDTTWVRAYNGKSVYTTGELRSDGNKIVIRGSSPTLYLRDTDERSGMIHMNSNRMYFLSGGVDSESWAVTANGRWPLYLQTDTNQAVFGGNIDAMIQLQISGGPFAGATTRLKNGYRWSLGQLNNYGLSSGASGMAYNSDQSPWSIWESDMFEGTSIAINGDTIAMISPADNNTINYYDEDNHGRLWYIQNNGTITAQSDARLKTDISDILFGSDENEELNKYKKLRIVSYKQKKPENLTRETTKYDKIYYGVIAQEVLELYPECVDAPDDGGYYSVHYNLLNLLTINVLQTEIKKREAAEKRIATMELLVSRVEILEANLQAEKVKTYELQKKLELLEMSQMALISRLEAIENM